MNGRTIQRAFFVAALLAAVALRTTFFVVSVRYVPASSDESIIGLQAKRIATQLRTPLLMMAQPYLFPLEAYASAPFIRWLPRTAFGVRLVPFIMGWVGVVCVFAVLRRLGTWRGVWPVALLVFFAPPRVAFVLADMFALTASQFQEDLRAAGVEARREVCGDWTIFSEFQSRERREFPRRKGEALRTRMEANPKDAVRLADGNPFSRWRALREQTEGMAVEVAWDGSARTRGVALYYNAWYQDRPRSLHVEVREDGTWRRVASEVPRDMDRFEMKNGHPVLGNQVQTIYWPVIEGDALRVMIAEPEPERDWAIGEIEVLVEEP